MQVLYSRDQASSSSSSSSSSSFFAMGRCGPCTKRNNALDISRSTTSHRITGTTTTTTTTTTGH
ncbi:hypothetical protein E2C01_024318 [Portunus trituberculatus]|uniref:Uncharacterized protein n=1 Tax=Portunus trituberculatus TaxID=210409 RepID=A0A5B7EAA7_PORTR|nr:hypothetical protein [Portunus trituberculatus]